MIGLGRWPSADPCLQYRESHYEEHLEFFSIKVQTVRSRRGLQHLREGDPIVVSKKPTGTLVLG